MQCEQCGIHVEPKANFCSSCGAKIMPAKLASRKLELESHVAQVMEEVLKTALRGNREVSGLGFLRQIPAYIWYVFVVLLCAGYYYFFNV